MFKLEMSTATDAMQEEGRPDGYAIAEQLTEMARMLQEGFRDGRLRDVNGNPIGFWELTDD